MGTYTLTLPAGEHLLRQELTPGWQHTGRDQSYGAGSFETTGVVRVPEDLITPAEAPTFSFGTRQPPSISGTVWRDDDYDGLRDPGEAGLQGTRMFLDADNDNVDDH